MPVVLTGRNTSRTLGVSAHGVSYRDVPILGLLGGVGGGKSYLARLFEDAGCCAVDSDQLARAALDEGDVRASVVARLGAGVLDGGGKIDRRAVARVVFADRAARQALEAIVHPAVERLRLVTMDRRLVEQPACAAFVWDSPLLLESGKHEQCDYLVFADAPLDVRKARVRAARGWADGELERREAAQWPVERKRLLADAVIDTTLPADALAARVRAVLDEVRATSPPLSS